MTLEAWFAALVGGSLLLLVVTAYLLASRRFRILLHPLTIVLAVAVVGVLVSVLGELIFRGGWREVPGIARRSAIGSTLWGLLIAGITWGVRRGLARWGE